THHLICTNGSWRWPRNLRGQRHEIKHEGLGEAPQERLSQTLTNNNIRNYSPFTAVHRSVKAEVLSLRTIHSRRLSVSASGAKPSLNSSCTFGSSNFSASAFGGTPRL